MWAHHVMEQIFEHEVVVVVGHHRCVKPEKGHKHADNRINRNKLNLGILCTGA